MNHEEKQSVGKRRASRELALKVLFQLDFGQGDVQEALNLYETSFKAPAHLWIYARRLVEGIAEQRRELDEALNRASRTWRLERLARVERGILRIAAWEMLFNREEVPAKAAINEAVELAKRYGSDEAPKLVNGVLDTLLSAA